MTIANKASAAYLARKRYCFGGAGYIAGNSPGVVTVNGVPSACHVEVRHRLTRTLLSVQFSAGDGTYIFADLDPNDRYDVIARDWQGVYADCIRGNITPHPI